MEANILLPLRIIGLIFLIFATSNIKARYSGAFNNSKLNTSIRAALFSVFKLIIEVNISAKNSRDF